MRSRPWGTGTLNVTSRPESSRAVESGPGRAPRTTRRAGCPQRLAEIAARRERDRDLEAPPAVPILLDPEALGRSSLQAGAAFRTRDLDPRQTRPDPAGERIAGPLHPGAVEGRCARIPARAWDRAGPAGPSGRPPEARSRRRARAIRRGGDRRAPRSGAASWRFRPTPGPSSGSQSQAGSCECSTILSCSAFCAGQRRTRASLDPRAAGNRTGAAGPARAASRRPAAGPGRCRGGPERREQAQVRVFGGAVSIALQRFELRAPRAFLLRLRSGPPRRAFSTSRRRRRRRPRSPRAAASASRSRAGDGRTRGGGASSSRSASTAEPGREARRSAVNRPRNARKAGEIRR